MGRIVALDVGDRTIGVAVSDESATIAFPRETIVRQAEGHRKDVEAVRRLVVKEGAERVVVGWPIGLDGSVGPQAEKVAFFVDRLRKVLLVPLDLQDERYTTSEAEKMLISADRSRAQRKAVVDSVAASLILQTYLEVRAARASRQADAAS